MNDLTGRLMDISPWATGFIQTGDGSQYGFHSSMIKEGPDLSSPLELEGKLVRFRAENGIVVEVVLQATMTDDALVTSHKASA